MKSPRGAGVLALAAFLAVAVPSGSLNAAESAGEVLRKYSEAIKSLSTIRFDATKKVYELGGPFKSWTWIDTEEIVFVSVGDEWRFRMRQRGNSWYGGKFFPFAIDVEHARNDRGDLYEVHKKHEPEDLLTEADALGFRIPEKAPTVMVTLEDSGDRGKRAGRLQEACRPIYGYLPVDNDRWLPDLMEKAGVRLADEPVDVDGHRTLVLTSRGAFGTHVVHVDPEAGYLPRRITCLKEGRDRYGPGEEPIGSQVARDDPDHRKPNSPLRKYNYEVKGVSIDPGGGRPFIKEFETLTTFTYLDRTEFRQREVVSLAKVSPSPEKAELALSEAIPDGTRVHIQNAPAIRSEWKGGRIVKAIDQTAVNSLADVTFRRDSGGRAWRNWIVTTNVAVLAALFGLLFLRQRRSIS